jgi:hypothetical protein
VSVRLGARGSPSKANQFGQVWLVHAENSVAHLAATHDEQVVELLDAHSALHWLPAQLMSGSAESTAPSQAEATHFSQHGPTSTFVAVCTGASAAGHAPRQLAVLKHAAVPNPETEYDSQVSNVPDCFG